jgi:FKBP-type peptidyl-prolyl cis-trans isomerase 2
VVDFNHPFAGLDLHFEGQVVRVGEAPPSLN